LESEFIFLLTGLASEAGRLSVLTNCQTSPKQRTLWKN